MTFIIIVLLSVSLCPAQESDAISGVILSIMDRQVAGWNNGTIETFMDGYLRSDSLRFASGGSVTYGWTTMLERYRKSYSTREKMGRLQFSKISITVISSDAALAFGTWELFREQDHPRGLFTLFWKKIDGKWFIVHDHTSSE